MALPVFNEGTQRYHDPDTNLMVKNPLASSGTSLKQASTEIRTSNPMESLMTIFQDMAMSLEVIKLTLEDMLDGQRQDDALADRNASISNADVIPPEDESRNDDPINKPPGFVKRTASKIGMGGVIKAGLIAGLAGIMLFSEQLTKALEPFLKFVKEKVFPIALAAFDLALAGAKKAIDLLVKGFDATVAAFKFLTDPETSLESKVEGVKTAIKEFGAWLFGLFDNLATKVAVAFGMDFEEGETLGSWIGDAIATGWQGIKDWFSGITPEWMPGFKDIGVWIVDKATAAFKGITKFFSGAVAAFKLGQDEDGKGGFATLGAYLKDKVITAFSGITDFFSGAIDKFVLGQDENGQGGFATIGAYLKDKLKSPFRFLENLFSFPEKPPEGYFSFTFAGQVLTKFIDMIAIVPNLAIAFLKDIFGFTDEEAEAHEDYVPFSIGGFVVGIFGKIVEFIKDKFKFDMPTFEMPEIPSISEMVATIVGAILPKTDGFIGKRLYGFDSMQGAYQMRLMYEANVAAEDMQAVQSGATAVLGNQMAAFRLATAGAGMTIIDQSNNTSTSSTSQDTYTASELGTDHQESTIKPAGNKEHLRNK